MYGSPYVFVFIYHARAEYLSSRDHTFLIASQPIPFLLSDIGSGLAGRSKNETATKTILSSLGVAV